MYGFRDPRGNRPMWIGRSRDGTTIIISSESYSLKKRDFIYAPISPGHLVFINQEGDIQLEQYNNSHFCRAHCIFEQVYLQRHLSELEAKAYETNWDTRVSMGRQLANSDPLFQEKTQQEILDTIKAIIKDIFFVVGLPEGANPVALGYANAIGLKNLDLLLIEGKKRSYMEQSRERNKKRQPKIIFN